MAAPEEEEVIPVKQLFMGEMMAGSNRRMAGSDYLMEFLRLGTAEDRGKMNQAQALGYQLAAESGSGSTRAERNAPKTVV